MRRQRRQGRAESRLDGGNDGRKGCLVDLPIFPSPSLSTAHLSPSLPSLPPSPRLSSKMPFTISHPPLPRSVRSAPCSMFAHYLPRRNVVGGGGRGGSIHLAALCTPIARARRGKCLLLLLSSSRTLPSFTSSSRFPSSEIFYPISRVVSDSASEPESQRERAEL